MKKNKYKGRIWLNTPPYYNTDDKKITVLETEIFSSMNVDIMELSCTFDMYKYTIIVYPKPYPIFFGNIILDNEIVGNLNFSYYENKKGRVALIGTWIEDEEYSCIIELAPIVS